MLDEQSGVSISRKTNPPLLNIRGNNYCRAKGYLDTKYERGYDDKGGASRFFYIAKAQPNERYGYCRTCKTTFPQKDYEKHKNHDFIFHSTVKPLNLIKYLVKLITPPKSYNPVILDPFFGTGTLGVVCEAMGIRWIGIEINEEYCEIAKTKIQELTPKMMQDKDIQQMKTQSVSNFLF